MEEGAVDIVGDDAGESPVGGAGANGGLAVGFDGSGVPDVFAGGDRQVAEHRLADGEGAHLKEVGSDADDMVGVLEMAVGAELALGIDEQDEGGGDADGQTAQVDQGEGRVFPEVPEGWFERVHVSKLRFFWLGRIVQSVRRFLAGLADAAFTDWLLTVSRAMPMAMAPARANVQAPRGIR